MTETETGLALLPEGIAPAALFADSKLADQLIEHISKVVADFKPDVTTLKGREEIASLAFKVARTKTTLDAAGKKLGEDARKTLDGINAQRNAFKGKLEELQHLARKPLDDWTAAEAKRVSTVQDLKARLEKDAIVMLSDTAATVRRRLMELQALTLPGDDVLQDFSVIIKSLRNTAINTLTAAYSRLVTEEKDRAELERLRREQQQREQAERDREAREAEELARQQRENEAREREEANRRAEQERTAEAEQRAAARERERIAAEEERQRQEEAARAADEQHRAKVIEEAAVDVANLSSLSPKTARVIVAAIVAGKVRGLSIKF